MDVIKSHVVFYGNFQADSLSFLLAILRLYVLSATLIFSFFPKSSPAFPMLDIYGLSDQIFSR